MHVTVLYIYILLSEVVSPTMTVVIRIRWRETTHFTEQRLQMIEDKLVGCSLTHPTYLSSFRVGKGIASFPASHTRY